jgi:hypothetical protein
MTSLVSCKALVCRQVARHQVPTVKLCDISIKFDRCRCRLFNTNNWTAVGEAVNGPLRDCEGYAGFSLEDISDSIRPNVRALDRIKRNMCGEGKGNEGLSSEDFIEPRSSEIDGTK